MNRDTLAIKQSMLARVKSFITEIEDILLDSKLEDYHKLLPTVRNNVTVHGSRY